MIRLPRRSWLLILVATAFVAGGCVVSTVNHLWATRNQFLKFDANVRYEKATDVLGPALHFLNPKLTRDDLRAIVSGRQPTFIRHDKGRETWVFRYLRRPSYRGKSIHLELEFQEGLLTRIRVDKRFSDYLGDDRIDMLVRQFVGPNTSLDLLTKRVVCRVPATELARFRPLTMMDVRALFGQENLIREVELKPAEPKHIFRYRLAGATGNKAAMSFGATFGSGLHLARITSRLGSFSLEFDLSGTP